MGCNMRACNAAQPGVEVPPAGQNELHAGRLLLRVCQGITHVHRAHVRTVREGRHQAVVPAEPCMRDKVSDFLPRLEAAAEAACCLHSTLTEQP